MEQSTEASLNGHAAETVDATERLEALCFRESAYYAASDYLTRMQSKQPNLPAPEGFTCDAMAPNNPTEETTSPQQTKKRKPCVDVAQGEGSTTECSDSPNSTKCHKEQTTDERENESAKVLINRAWREKICEWAFAVVDQFELRREVVSIMMNHLDRYLSAYPIAVDKKFFQLLSMTCLYMAIKLNEYDRILLPNCKSSIESIIQLSRGSFTVNDMAKVEQDILQRLQWRVHPPTPQVFLQLFLNCMPSEMKQDTKIQDTAQFLVELAAMDYFFVPYKPSEIALAAMLGALDESCDSNQKMFIDPFLARFSEAANVLECKTRLILVHFETMRHEALPEDPSNIVDSSRSDSPVSVMDVPQRS